MKEKVFDFLLAATIAAVVTILVVLQEQSLTNPEILAMASIGSIAGMFSGFIKMLIVDGKFDKWSLLAYFIGVAVIYISVTLGVCFR